jgi:dipeptidyl aminopeptidase/acylaminoacyl peptidase
LEHIHPKFLPDGRHFLLYVQGSAEVRGVYVGELDTPVIQRIVDSEAAAVYAWGRLHFVRQGKLFAQEFDPERLTLSGKPTILSENVTIGGRSVAALASAGGHVAYRTSLEGSLKQLTWFDRSGRKLETVGEPFLAGAGAPSISPDGKSVVVNRLMDGSGDIWTVNLSNGAFTRFTSDLSNDSYPVWSHDGRKILFASNSTGSMQIYEKPVGVTAAATMVFSKIGVRHPMDFSRDGRYLLYRANIADLWALQREGMKEIPIIRGPIEIRFAQFSPDGKWIAFQSNATGRNEIYIHGPFEPPSLGKTSQPLSSNGGAWVRWRNDGKELFYAAPDGTIMAIPIDVTLNGREIKAGSPEALFRAPMAGGPNNNSLAQQYLVAENGQRFLILAAPPAISPIKVILNWK